MDYAPSNGVARTSPSSTVDSVFHSCLSNPWEDFNLDRTSNFAVAMKAPIGTTGLQPLASTLRRPPPSPSSTPTTTGMQSNSTGPSEAFLLGIHVYDLTGGFLARHGRTLIGKECRGILHSAVVVYGFEYFFEGGVCRTPKGKTRFGPEYEFVNVGCTCIKQAEFERWVRKEERRQFKLCDYDSVRHNCHHFTSLAVQLLCGSAAPEFLLENTRDLACSPLGKLILPLFSRITGGIQFLVSKQLEQHMQQRRVAHQRQKVALDRVGVPVVPSRVALLFGSTAEGCSASLLRLISDMDPEVDVFVPNRLQIDSVAKLAAQVAFSAESLSEFDVASVVEVLVGYAEAEESWRMTPIFDAWRILALHKSFVGVAAYDLHLNTILLRTAKDYHSLSLGTKVSFMRTLCNYFVSPHGAAMIVDDRRVHRWVSIAGEALTDNKLSIVQNLGASLLHNISIALLIVVRGSLENELMKQGRFHVAHRIVTILLFFIQSDVDEHIFTRLLMALFRLVEHGYVLTSVIVLHPLRLNYDGLLAKCKTNESRSLVCLLSAFEEIFDEEESTLKTAFPSSVHLRDDETQEHDDAAPF